jgi:hypothetical protein
MDYTHYSAFRMCLMSFYFQDLQLKLSCVAVTFLLWHAINETSHTHISLYTDRFYTVGSIIQYLRITIFSCNYQKLQRNFKKCCLLLKFTCQKMVLLVTTVSNVHNPSWCTCHYSSSYLNLYPHYSVSSTQYSCLEQLQLVQWTIQYHKQFCLSCVVGDTDVLL